MIIPPPIIYGGNMPPLETCTASAPRQCGQCFHHGCVHVLEQYGTLWRKLRSRPGFVAMHLQHGFKLVPVVAESYSGWGRQPQEAFKWLAHAHTSRTCKSVSQATLEFYSSLSIHLMRANARALLARVAVPGAELGCGCRARGVLVASA